MLRKLLYLENSGFPCYNGTKPVWPIGLTRIDVLKSSFFSEIFFFFFFNKSFAKTLLKAIFNLDLLIFRL